MIQDHRAGRRSPRLLILLGLAAIFATIAWRIYLDTGQRFVGTVPPEFPAGGAWIGADQPLRLSELRGRVVLLQFSFVSCPYCREMDPYLHKWHEQFGSEGLVIVEIDDGSTESLEEVRNWAASSGIPYPLYYDDNGRMCAAYDIHSFPYVLLVGRGGKVVWELRGWLGESGMAKMEDQIRKALVR
jgi:thiol-disulfide isomerase/thioredoxin